MLSVHKFFWSKCLLLAVCGLGCFSCTTTGSDLGNDWLEESTRVVVIDTANVTISTFLLDSVITSNGYRIIIGKQQDDDFGKTKASTYFAVKRTDNFNYPNYDITGALDADYYFDSLTFSLYYDGTYYGDTTQMFRFNVHRLTEKIEPNDNGNLYGFYEFAYDPVPLATYEFMPRPTHVDSLVLEPSDASITVRLSDDLGREFFQKLLDRDDEMTLSEPFNNYFYGLALIPDESTETLLGFLTDADKSCMTLHYHTVGAVVEDELEATFEINKSLMYTRTEFDRTNTPLQDISLYNKEIRSDLTGHKAFLSSLGGMYMKIEFPYLNGLNGLGRHVEIVEAALFIYPSQENYVNRGQTVLPDSINIYISNEKNVITGAITDNNEQLQVGSFLLDETFRSGTYYVYDVTDFLRAQKDLQGVNKSNLQMVISNYGYSLYNLSVDDQTVGEDNIKLMIKLGIYDY